MTELYVTHENSSGERRYQPCLDTGQRLYWESTAVGSGKVWAKPVTVFGGYPGWPKVYRSRGKAARVARREMRRREREQQKVFKEVEQ